MANKILVPLKKGDRVGDLVPYLKEVSQPGMSVVFLIRRPVNDFRWLQAYYGVMEGIDNAVELWKMVEGYSVETSRQLAQERVFPACKHLHELGVKIAVEVYNGGLKKVLRCHIRNGDVELVVVKPWVGLRITSFLKESVCLWGALRQPPSPALSFQAYSGGR